MIPDQGTLSMALVRMEKLIAGLPKVCIRAMNSLESRTVLPLHLRLSIPLYRGLFPLSDTRLFIAPFESENQVLSCQKFGVELNKTGIGY
jgi:hypothetical protein